MGSAPSSSDDGHGPLRRRTGFALPGRASAAGRKGHALGLTRRWTAQEARSHAPEGGQALQARLTAEQLTEQARRLNRARWDRERFAR
jgi:hypothetical protein